LRTVGLNRDLRELEGKQKFNELIKDGTKLELVEYEQTSEEVDAFRMSFGDCSENVSCLSERPSEFANVFLRSPIYST
jgi:hypothetical protein